MMLFSEIGDSDCISALFSELSYTTKNRLVWQCKQFYNQETNAAKFLF